jgi:hypothetical protein
MVKHWNTFLTSVGEIEMDSRKLRQFLSGVLILIGLTACGPSAPVDPGSDNTDILYTQAAQTVVAKLTLEAGQTAIAQLTEIAQQATPTASMEAENPPPASPSPVPATATANPTNTPEPSATPLPPTATPLPPSPTPLPPTATPILVACDWASFVADVHISDGETLKSGATFTKTWRLKNIGSCTWTREYSLVFVSGAQMDAPNRVWLDTQVRPGETVDVSMQFKAPTRAGEYIGYWQLRNANGVNFGIGETASRAFWIKIRVHEPTQMAFNLAENYCSAEWRNRFDPISCPGQLTDIETGFVILQAEPILETGTKENEPGIVVRPDMSDGGMVQGRFPPFKVEAGDRFRTVIGCMADNPDCRAIFQLNYRADGGEVHNLGTWTEVFDRSYNKLDIDLSPLAGRSVEFILTVLNDGNSKDDTVFWLLPRVMR